MADVVKIAEEISIIMPRISRQIMSDLFTTVDIPHAQLFVIMTLFHTGSCRTCDIGRQLKVTAPTATGIVDRLEKAGYVSRSTDQEDRRTVMVNLTVEGKKLALRVKDKVVERWADLLQKIPAEDAEKYLEILHKIKEAL
ncbi:MAG: MarR family transcriptional regulator [Candidatus Omnitrophica bacterium]|nr:MarR family transcriptional regulator [Candidatus Omnitrophota bacterium]